MTERSILNRNNILHGRNIYIIGIDLKINDS